MAFMGNTGRAMGGAVGMGGKQQMPMNAAGQQPRMGNTGINPRANGPMGPSQNMWMQRNGGMGMPKQMPGAQMPGNPWNQGPTGQPFNQFPQMPKIPWGQNKFPGGFQQTGMPRGPMNNGGFNPPRMEGPGGTAPIPNFMDQIRQQYPGAFQRDPNQMHTMGGGGLGPSQGFVDPGRYGGRSMPGVMY